MKAPILILYLLLSANLATQKNIKDSELLQGTWSAEGDKKSIIVVKTDTIYSIYLGSSSYYSKNRFSLEKEVLFNEQKVKANEGETFLVTYDNDGIESVFYLLGVNNKILSLMKYDTGHLVIYNKSRRKIDLSSLPK